MAVYPVSIRGKSTLYIKATKPAITAKMKSLGIKNFTIQNAVSKQMLSKVKLTPLNKVKAPSAAGLGKTPGGPNNPGMKPDLEARSKLPDAVQKKKDEEAAKRKKQPPNKRGGSGNQTKKNVKPKTTVNKKTVGNQQKIKDLAKKVKARMPNVSMSKILDTIRTQIRKRPLTAVAGATGVGVAIGTILSALKPTKVADATLTGNKLQVTNTKGGQKNKGSRPRSRITKPSGVSITIATPLPKPKRDNGKKKKDKGGSGMMLSLIVGGKGTTADRMKEIKAEKKLEKQLGRRPSKKELVAYLKKN
jgi:ElaB/YqjD/DUF883 family membrane-anchored ribosome-binding protein